MSKQGGEIELHVERSAEQLNGNGRLHTPSKRQKKERGITITFEDIHFSIETQKGVNKKILRGVSAHCEPGKMMAVMGPSGSGKTTLLNILSNRVTTTTDKKMTLDGKILYNGIPLNSETKKLCGYVAQDNYHINNLSVREILQNSALLRLPEDVPKEEKIHQVDKVIDGLGLESCVSTIVGGSMLRGISGGEKKRLSVGVEMITNPLLLFMDEPTSGLDSHMAFSLFEKIDHLKAMNRTIIATIHQPSSKLVEKFDYILLLSEGYMVYFGETKEAISYFLEKCSLRCPLYSNPAEFFIDVCSLYHEPELDVGYEGEGTIDWKVTIDACEKYVRPKIDEGIEDMNKKLQKALSTSAVEINLEPMEKHKNAEEVETSENEHTKANGENGVNGNSVVEEGEDHEVYETKVRFATGFATQMKVLAKRSFTSLIRDRRYFRARVVQVAVMSILIGVIFLQLPNSQAGLRSRSGAIFFLTMQFGVGPMMSVLHVFSHERIIIEHERAGKWYGVLPYFFAKSFSEIPLQIIEPILYICITYFMIGLNPNVDRFFTFIGLGILTSVCGSSLGLILGASTPTFEVATIFAGLLMLLLILFSGFFLDSNLIPVWLRWIKYISYIYYSFNIALKNEFLGEEFYCAPGELPTSKVCPITTGEEALKSIGVDPDLNSTLYFFILLIFFVGVRSLTYLVLRVYRPKAD